jgi:hypothetical protein
MGEDWLSVAETFEFLPAEEQPGRTRAPWTPCMKLA